MTEVNTNSSPAELRQELLGTVKSLKSRIINSDGSAVSLKWEKAAGNSAAPLNRRANIPARLVDKTAGSGNINEKLNNLCHEMQGCLLCPLGKTRRNLVFGDGNPHARLVFVGEAPGADEDEQGLPFVGRAGQLLTKIIEAMGLQRKDVYICNILKCRPPQNRNPLPDEITACEPFLKKQLQIIAPEYICALGSFSAKTLLQKETPITALRGRFHFYEGIKLMPTYHPAYLLRNPAAKKFVWDDMQLIMQELGLNNKEKP